MPENLKGNDFIRDCLFDALVSLMGEMPFRDIAITDITRRAGVSRMAYYRNYSSKEDILTAHLNRVIGEYFRFSSLPPDEEHHISRKNISEMFSVFRRNQKFFSACQEAGLGYYILDAITGYLRQNFSGTESDLWRDYALTAYASSIYAIALHWTRNGSKESPDQLTELLYSIYGPHI